MRSNYLSRGRFSKKASKAECLREYTDTQQRSALESHWSSRWLTRSYSVRKTFQGDNPVKSFNQVTEMGVVGSRKKVTRRAGLFSPVVHLNRSARGRARAEIQGRCDGAGSEVIGNRPSSGRRFSIRWRASLLGSVPLLW